MPLNPTAGRLRPLLFVLLAAAAAGCSEEIAPPDALAAYYTLWGALNPESDVQAIRVIPVQNEPRLEDPTPLDVTMTSRDVETGTTVAWRDSVVVFADGSIGHVFVADTGIRYGASYRVEVENAAGATTAANVRVPTLVEPLRQATRIGIDGVFMPVLWQGAPQLNRLTVTYRLRDAACREFDYPLAFQGEAEPFEFGWTTTIELRADADRVLSDVGRGHTLVQVTLGAEVASDEWRPPGGVFNPEVLIEPGVFSNVERGFGFVGGAYPTAFSWTPEPAAVTAAGFQPPDFCN